MKGEKPLRAFESVGWRARELRKEMTPAEKLLWERLRNRQLGGYKFRRQAPMGTYIADFYCAARRLIVELDGKIHDSQEEYDCVRTEMMESFGYRVIRFRNSEVDHHITGVSSTILQACQAPLSPNGEREG